MDEIIHIFKHEWLVFPLFGILVFFIVYKSADKVVDTFIKKNADKKSQILSHMRLLGMDANDKKVNLLLLLSSFGLGFLFFLLLWPEVSMG